MLRRAIHVRTQIEHGGGGALGIRHLGGDGRTVDAFDRLQHVARNRHQGTGVACGHGRLRLTFLDLGNGHAHGGILLLAQCDFHRVFHGNHLGGRHDAHALGRNGGRFLEAGPARTDGLGLPHQQQLHIGVTLQKTGTGRQCGAQAVVAPHAIHRQRHWRRRFAHLMRPSVAIQEKSAKTKSPRLRERRA